MDGCGTRGGMAELLSSHAHTDVHHQTIFPKTGKKRRAYKCFSPGEERNVPEKYFEMYCSSIRIFKSTNSFHIMSAPTSTWISCFGQSSLGGSFHTQN